MNRSDPPQKYVKSRDLGISKNPNIGEVDGIHLANSRKLIGGETKPPDGILMCCSANVPGITYKINLGICRPPFLKQTIWELHQAILVRLSRSSWDLDHGSWASIRDSWIVTQLA